MAGRGRPRTFIRFEERSEVETSHASLLRYVADDGPPRERFHRLLTHQSNFLHWLDQRHTQLTTAKQEIAQLTGAPPTRGPNGPKSETFRKYQAYSEQLVLLEAINGFEVFFKTTFVELARCLKLYIPDVRVKGTADARALWLYGGAIDPVSVLFESRLFHDVDEIDKATQMLIDQKYYAGGHDVIRQQRLQAMKCIFQIRHTLSHNSGVVTHSDSAKYALIGFKATPSEFIDPSADGLGVVVLEFLRDEADEYTEWIRGATVAYLITEMRRTGSSVPQGIRESLQACLGGTESDYAAIP